MDVDPHLDHGLILDPPTVVTMGLVVLEPDALGQTFSKTRGRSDMWKRAN